MYGEDFIALSTEAPALKHFKAQFGSQRWQRE
jgi:hypothetical protein